MKKLLFMIIGVFILCSVLASCSQDDTSKQKNYDTAILEATVIEHDEGLLVTPVVGSSELLSADRIFVNVRTLDELNDHQYEVGDLLRITYDGMIAESYPAQIWASKIEHIGRNILIDGYLEIIDDIYQEDSALNDNITMIALDTSQCKALMPVEKEILIDSLKAKYSLETIEASYNDLVDMGLIDEEELYFTEGILIEIKDFKYKEGSNILSAKISKWRSGKGAIGWDLEASYKDGEWEIIRANTWIS